VVRTGHPGSLILSLKKTKFILKEAAGWNLRVNMVDKLFSYATKSHTLFTLEILSSVDIQKLPFSIQIPLINEHLKK